MAAPLDPPENRPSVISATYASSPMPAMAEVGVDLSRHRSRALEARGFKGTFYVTVGSASMVSRALCPVSPQCIPVTLSPLG